MSSRLDYCNAVFAGAPRHITDRLQRVLNAAACIVSDTRKFDHDLSRLMHTELHWLDVPERVEYKLGVLMYRCQHNQAPLYLMDHCTPVSDFVLRQCLHSASSHHLFVPRYWLSMYGHRAFSVVASTVWNSLPEDIRDPECSVDTYRQSLKTFYFHSTNVSVLGMYQISAPALAGPASGHFWQIRPSPAPARILALAGFVAAVWSVSRI